MTTRIPSTYAGLALPTQRLYLLWLLVEDALRNEVSYTPAVGELWRENLSRVNEAIAPLAFAARRLATEDNTDEIFFVQHVGRYVNRKMRAAIERVSETSQVNASGFFDALQLVRQARLALEALIERTGPISEPAVDWSPDDLKALNLSGVRLRGDLDAFLVAANGDRVVEQCRTSRQVFLSIYWTATFSEEIAAEFFEPVLRTHRDLVERMTPSVARDCVQQRLDLLRSIPPTRFSEVAARIGSALLSSQIAHAGELQGAT